jgi:tungstate transport system ATP-binding protein
MLYELRDLVKSYGPRTVLDVGRLDLRKGKITGLLGPNGSGKTTLLGMLAFLWAPTAGELRFEGEPVNFSHSRLLGLRRRVVLVQQHPILFTTTVSKNVEFPLKIRKIPKAHRYKIVAELLDLVGMGGFRDSRAHRLSEGETQRVAIARALACSPEVVLLDEPTSSVDMENQIAIERIIQDINRSKEISVVLTTHNMMQASRLAHETVFLYEGRVARSIYENIFSATVEEGDSGKMLCILQSGLTLQVRSDRTGSVRLSIDPSRLEIHPREKRPVEENAFSGTLVQITDERDQVRALVDVGLPVSVLVPKSAFNAMKIGLGETLWLSVPLQSIDMF